MRAHKIVAPHVFLFIEFACMASPLSADLSEVKDTLYMLAGQISNWQQSQNGLQVNGKFFIGNYLFIEFSVLLVLSVICYGIDSC